MTTSIDQPARVQHMTGRPLWLIPVLLFRRTLFTAKG